MTTPQEYPVYAFVPQGYVLGPTLLLLFIIDLLDDVICNTVTYADDTTLQSRSNQAFDFLKQLELTFDLESDQLQGEAGVGSGLLISMLENFNFCFIDWSDKCGTTDVKMNGSNLDKKSVLKAHSQV